MPTLPNVNRQGRTCNRMVGIFPYHAGLFRLGRHVMLCRMLPSWAEGKLTLATFPRKLLKTPMHRTARGEKETDTVRHSRCGIRLAWRFDPSTYGLLCTFLALSMGFVLSCFADPADFERDIRPTLKQYCLDCHSTEKHKGDLDLERFKSQPEILKHPKVWERVIEQLSLGEMPPKAKPQPTPAERERLIVWVNTALDQAAKANAGDPGPVVLRRLSNAEYTYTLRDLTGVASLDPAREFPVDSASGEGFMNVGNSLVMSPALFSKYLDAAKDIAAHAVLLPDGIGFSASTSPRDWTEERLAAIRAFYARFTEPGSGSAIVLQGVKLDSPDRGVLPLKKYLAATLSEHVRLTSWRKSLTQVAREQGLNEKYLTLLWNALNNREPSLLLDQVRAQWRTAKPGDVDALVQTVSQWQQSLWHFALIGHIGKRDGPKAWQEPVTPLVNQRELRLPLLAKKDRDDLTVYLAVSDAGDGNQNDFAVWENPRLVAAGRPDLALRDVAATWDSFTALRKRVFGETAACLDAAAQIQDVPDEKAVTELADKHGVGAAALKAWMDCLGIGAGEARIDSYLKQPLEKTEKYDFVKGWTGDQALSVVANPSDQLVHIPGNMKPHSVAVHPAPTKRAVIGWRSPVNATLRVDGLVHHAHPECGNGVTWAVELRRANFRQRLAAGVAQKNADGKFGPLENLAVRQGDLIVVAIGPRDGNHSCDLTAVDLSLTDGSRTWDLAKDVSPDILAGNPHTDGFGNAGVWNFFIEPDTSGGVEVVLPAGSLLTKWQSSTNTDEQHRLAGEVQQLLVNGPSNLATNSPDRALHRQLTSLNGPLLASVLRSSGCEFARTPRAENQSGQMSAAAGWGVDPTLFGRHPNGAKVGGLDLCVQAPSVIEVQLPAEIVAGSELVVMAKLQHETGAEGSVQMQILTNKPGMLGLVASSASPGGGKKTWSDGERPVDFAVPVIVNDGSAAKRRLDAAMDQFRALFPAALCYTKVVPVDEVITLTLFFREDDQLRRLMLDDAQTAELDRLWGELRYISQDALKLVDAFEQLWQYATQDADPSAFAPLREPIQQRAEEFRKRLTNSEPAHLDAVLKFAAGAYRRPLTSADQNELRELYRKLRTEEMSHPDAVRLTLARVLVSPAFLYRTEQPAPGKQPGPVTDWELATRLSYFLWSSAPDNELRELAARGQLHRPHVLTAQARRMLQDPRVRRLATEFACTWLHIHDFESFDEKSEKVFPAFAALRGPMYEEAIQFFADLFQRDGSVLEIFDADHTFVNGELAEHYGIPESVFRGSGHKSAQLLREESQSQLTSTATNANDGWRRVDGVKQFGRGGILGMGATLAKQSGASRTSPILRGNWVSEVLLGDKLPRPPKDVPRLPEDEATETLTVRELTRRHSSDPRCAGCHMLIDGYGFTLEGFDAIGRSRTRDLGGREIDTVAKVVDGTTVYGAAGLREYLLTKKRDVVVNQFCRKLLGYALGRAVMLSDKPLLAEMQANLKKHDYRLSAALDTLIRSRQFREIRGREALDDDFQMSAHSATVQP